MFKPINLPVHVERIVIIGLKKEKTIRTNPNKVQLFKLFIGQG
ncbi:hypothetical protein CCP3SC1AL1_1440014 [Gammaproteobacteria bacterium]